MLRVTLVLLCRWAPCEGRLTSFRYDDDDDDDDSIDYNTHICNPWTLAIVIRVTGNQLWLKITCRDHVTQPAWAATLPCTSLRRSRVDICRRRNRACPTSALLSSRRVEGHTRYAPPTWSVRPRWLGVELRSMKTLFCQQQPQFQ